MSTGVAEKPHAQALPPRPPELAMHFDNMHQQYQSGKLGMWLFLGQELLFFAGLFTAYAVYRGNHTEMFHLAHYFLDWRMGALNTVVLLVSSLTAAWSVRAAMLEQRKVLLATLIITFVCAGIFMVVKYFEYAHKIEIGAVWGGGFGVAPEHLPAAMLAENPGMTAQALSDRLTELGAGTFFAIYFCMTGLHGLHVLVGMGLYIWLIVRALKGHFNRRHYGAVDNVALYWHIVDIIWIFLFPLLYLM